MVGKCKALCQGQQRSSCGWQMGSALSTTAFDVLRDEWVKSYDKNMRNAKKKKNVQVLSRVVFCLLVVEINTNAGSGLTVFWSVCSRIFTTF